MTSDGLRMVQQVTRNVAGDGQRRMFVTVIGESVEALTDLLDRIEAWADESHDEEEVS